MLMIEFLKYFRDYLIIKRSGLFDPANYLINNPDVRKADIDPLMHFIKYGWKEGRNPSKNFDVHVYLKSNPEVLELDTNPLIYYLNTELGISQISEGKYDQIKLSQFHLNFLIKSGKILRFSNIKWAINCIRLYGFIYFLRKLHSIIFKNNIIFNLSNNKQGLIIHNLKNEILSNLNEDELIPYEVKISVIIPTKNAGTSFELLLKNLLNQKGIKEVEIIVVDSGSNDDTLQVAKGFDAKIIAIKPEEFSHSFARNKGIDNATGDFILLTVQDALPPTDTWLYELLWVIKNNDVCAVSCAETPREDADLFYRVISWNHYNFLGVNGSNKIMQSPEKDDFISLRQNAQISDIACLIKTEIISKYKYKLDYAEDLDLGIRLIKDNHKIAFLGNTRVIHSHNRSAYYFLKRGYVDNIFLSDVFSDFSVPNVNFQDFSSDVVFTYNFFQEVVSKKISNFEYPLQTPEFLTRFEELFTQVKNLKYPSSLASSNEVTMDVNLYEFINEITKHHGLSKAGLLYSGFLVNSLSNFMNIIMSYVNSTYEKIEQELLFDLINSLYKAFALQVGAHLAYCYINRSYIDRLDLEKMHQRLKEGV